MTKKKERKPAEPGTHYGELSPEGHWFWKGTGSPEDEWVSANGPEAAELEQELEAKREAELEHVARLEVPEEQDQVQPLAASASFYITVNMTYPAGATQIAQANTYQVVTPWGQSTPCINLKDAFNQAFSAGSAYSGQLWNYLANGVTRGLVTTGGATVPQSATPFQSPP